MLKDLHVKVLGFINDQNRVLAFLPFFQKEPVQFIDKLFLGVPLRANPIILVDALEQFQC